jgi:hypothetical protein
MKNEGLWRLYFKVSIYYYNFIILYVLFLKCNRYIIKKLTMSTVHDYHLVG